MERIVNNSMNNLDEYIRKFEEEDEEDTSGCRLICCAPAHVVDEKEIESPFEGRRMNRHEWMQQKNLKDSHTNNANWVKFNTVGSESYFGKSQLENSTSKNGSATFKKIGMCLVVSLLQLFLTFRFCNPQYQLLIWSRQCNKSSILEIVLFSWRSPRFCR
jgi:hypothetical protein